MKRFTMIYGVMFLLVAAGSVKAFADPVPAMMEYLKEELATLDGATSDASPSIAPAPEAWYFQNLWIRMRTRAEFEIPGFAKVKVIPEAEILLQREIPQGWSAYKPKPLL